MGFERTGYVEVKYDETAYTISGPLRPSPRRAASTPRIATTMIANVTIILKRKVSRE